MNSIPWLASVEDMPTLELWVFGLAIIALCLAAGFTVDFIMRDSGFGPVANGVLALAGVLLGIYLRYRLLAANSLYDFWLTSGMGLGTACVLLFGLSLVRSRTR
ncbi:MAG: hypothetical protein ABR970_02325 [Roseiarcus sp.]|jgi:hypothetical protein